MREPTVDELLTKIATLANQADEIGRDIRLAEERKEKELLEIKELGHRQVSLRSSILNFITELESITREQDEETKPNGRSHTDTDH